jgi:hypothetical protein
MWELISEGSQLTDSQPINSIAVSQIWHNTGTQYLGLRHDFRIARHGG